MESSRFSKYGNGDYAPLFKPEPGESRVGKLEGDHEFTAQGDDGEERVLPVLDFVDEHGEKWSWRASTWRALEELKRVDPQVGKWYRITRLPDRGRSHDYIVEPAELSRDEVPF